MELIKSLWAKLSIPIKVLLPAMCLFSGLLLFGNEKLLERLRLETWVDENGSKIGLLFVFSLCITVAYILAFLWNRLSCFIDRKTVNKRIERLLDNLNDNEIGLVLMLYKEYGHTARLDLNNPTIQSLINRGILVTGATQLVTVSIYSNELPAQVTLNPRICKAMDDELRKAENRVEKLRAKQHKIRNESKRRKLEKEILENEEIMRFINS